MSQQNGMSGSKRLLNDDLMVVGKSGIASKRESVKTGQLKKDLEVVSVQTPLYSRNLNEKQEDGTLHDNTSRRNMRAQEHTKPNTDRESRQLPV